MEKISFKLFQKYKLKKYFWGVGTSGKEEGKWRGFMENMVDVVYIWCENRIVKPVQGC
jgi:hypothetical protein